MDWGQIGREIGVGLGSDWSLISAGRLRNGFFIKVPTVPQELSPFSHGFQHHAQPSQLDSDYLGNDSGEIRD